MTDQARPPYTKDDIVPGAVFQVASGAPATPVLVDVTVHWVDFAGDQVHYRKSGEWLQETTVERFLAVVNQARR